jgi:hypothetical protein
MHIAFALFADAANLSQEGKLNILGVFDALQVGSLPAVHPRATLVLRFKAGAADVGTHALRLQWQSPTGESLWATTGELSVAALPPGAAELDMPLIAMIDLPIDRAGEYQMRVAVDDTLLTSLALHVRAPEGAQAPRGGRPGASGKLVS